MTPTTFHPQEVANMEIVGYLGKKGVCRNPIVKFDLFDSVHLIPNQNKAVAYRNQVPTILILKG